MKYLRLISTVVFAAGLALGSGPSGAGKPGENGNSAARSAPEPARSYVPPVLREPEPSDNVVVRLPGPPPPRVVTSPPSPAPKEVAKAVPPPVLMDPPPPSVTQEDPGRPILKRAPRPIYPPDFEKDSASYCQRLIGQWTLEDAAMLFGDAAKLRPAYDDNQKENGTIYAFGDPTNRYRQLELDFDSKTGTLRTVFVYPWNMTWQECRKLWGGKVSAAVANQGRKFYSYLDRRLDVLVDPSGKVISLGLY